jgi:pyrimidine-nucleoside phosphorylase
MGQTADIDPADKKLYALRDVTGTVESIPLIASSIMSKKLASGSDCILLDVKFGSGAFMKTFERAKELADDDGGDRRFASSRYPRHFDRYGSAAWFSGRQFARSQRSDQATLNGQGPKDLVELVEQAGAIMLEQAKIVKSHEEGVKRIQQAIDDRLGLSETHRFFHAQGGDISYIEHPEKFPVAKYAIEVRGRKFRAT